MVYTCNGQGDARAAQLNEPPPLPTLA
jgi:hypothetical protein